MARTAAPAAARPASRRRASAPPPRRPPRRVSGPAAAGGGAVALPARVLRAPFARAARARAGTVLDALLQGRAWIALVAVLLVGIVFFNVDLLELNRDIARTADKAARIKRENAALSLQVARLASSDRIQRVAASRGLELPAPGDVHYLRLHPGVDARNAAARVVAPGSAGPAPSASGTPTPAPTPQPQSPGPGAQSPAPSAPATTPTPIPSSPPPPTTPQATGSPSGGAAPATGTGG